MHTSLEHLAPFYQELQNRAATYRYGVYGISLLSEIPLSLPEHPNSALAEIKLYTASDDWFNDALRGVEMEESGSAWYQYARLSDRSSYARWDGVGEFLISADGRVIVCRHFGQVPGESFRVYLLGQALSFALVKRGFEPLHATVVVVDNAAVAFLGDSGFGKSSLAASFLDAGHRVLTDDLLLLQAMASCVLAYPGAPRIKLMPKTARRFLGGAVSGVRMNPETEKLILSLDRKQSCSIPVPLKAVYSLAGLQEVFPNQEIRSLPLPLCQAFIELVKNTFNIRIRDADRLERQLNEAARLVRLVPVRKLWFPRVWRQLPSVREAIIADLKREDFKAIACGD